MKMRNRQTPATGPTASDPAQLPFDLAACLESVSVVQRAHGGEEGREVRAVVQLGNAGWVHTAEETKTQLLKRWPELGEAALQRAMRYVEARVRLVCEPPPAARRRNWALDW